MFLCKIIKDSERIHRSLVIMFTLVDYSYFHIERFNTQVKIEMK